MPFSSLLELWGTWCSVKVSVSVELHLFVATEIHVFVLLDNYSQVGQSWILFFFFWFSCKQQPTDSRDFNTFAYHPNIVQRVLNLRLPSQQHRFDYRGSGGLNFVTLICDLSVMLNLIFLNSNLWWNMQIQKIRSRFRTMFRWVFVSFCPAAFRIAIYSFFFSFYTF